MTPAHHNYLFSTLATHRDLGLPMRETLQGLGLRVVWCDLVQDGHYLACLDNPPADWLEDLRVKLPEYEVEARWFGAAAFQNLVSIVEKNS